MKSVGQLPEGGLTLTPHPHHSTITLTLTRNPNQVGQLPEGGTVLALTTQPSPSP